MVVGVRDASFFTNIFFHFANVQGPRTSLLEITNAFQLLAVDGEISGIGTFTTPLGEQISGYWDGGA